MTEQKRQRLFSTKPEIYGLAAITLLWLGLAGLTWAQTDTETAESVSPQPQADTIIRVFFEGECPVGVDQQVVNSKKEGSSALALLQWRAVKLESPSETANKEFQILYSPFIGGPKIKAKHPDYETSPLAVDATDFTNILYKYTVVATAEAGKDCEPLDPFIRVR